MSRECGIIQCLAHRGLKHWSAFYLFGAHKRKPHRCSCGRFLRAKGWCGRCLPWNVESRSCRRSNWNGSFFAIKDKAAPWQRKGNAHWHIRTWSLLFSLNDREYPQTTTFCINFKEWSSWCCKFMDVRTCLGFSIPCWDQSLRESICSCRWLLHRG